MSAARTAGALAGALLLLATGSLTGAASAGDATTTIGIRNGSSERSFSLTRTKVPPGLALIQYTNTGEDPHDVRIQRKGSDTVVELPETPSGGVNSFPVMKLKADSKYILWCSLDGHRESGMEADLKVKKKKR
jgi:plastocyanin